MITYEKLQAMSKEICELDRLQWAAALARDSVRYEELTTEIEGKMKLYEIAYEQFYASYFCQSKFNHANI